MSSRALVTQMKKMISEIEEEDNNTWATIVCNESEIDRIERPDASNIVIIKTYGTYKKVSTIQ